MGWQHRWRQWWRERLDQIRTRRIIAGILRVEAANNVHRQPNPNGENPVCMPAVGKPPISHDDGTVEHRRGPSICHRCGNHIDRTTYDGPCPAVPPDQRWGATWSGANT